MDMVFVDVIHEGCSHAVSLSYATNPAIVVVRFEDGREFSGRGGDVYSAFLNLRDGMPGYIFQCKGAKINVHPSRMSSQMGAGLMAYELSLGRQARRADLVNIFAPDVVDGEVSPNDQEAFFCKWLCSLGG